MRDEDTYEDLTCNAWCTAAKLNFYRSRSEIGCHRKVGDCAHSQNNYTDLMEESRSSCSLVEYAHVRGLSKAMRKRVRRTLNAQKSIAKSEAAIKAHTAHSHLEPPEVIWRVASGGLCSSELPIA